MFSLGFAAVVYYAFAVSPFSLVQNTRSHSCIVIPHYQTSLNSVPIKTGPWTKYSHALCLEIGTSVRWANGTCLSGANGAKIFHFFFLHICKFI